MLEWLRKAFGLRSAAEVRRENPVLVAAIKESAAVYQRTRLATLIDPAACDSLSRQIYLETNAVCNAADPVAACREKLAMTMLRFALYQVLMIQPAPAEDQSGMRGLPGVSGALAPYLDELAHKNMGLVADIHESDYFSEDVSIEQVAEIQFWIHYWLLETLNVARQELGDMSKGTDWYLPFKHAVCASQENLYRIDLDIPSAFPEEISRTAPTAYSIFTDIVISGAKDPVTEWCDYHDGLDIPVPGHASKAAAKTERKASGSR